MRLPLSIACCCLLLAGCETVPRSPAPVTPWEQTAGRDYEKTSPGLGYSWRFEAAQGWAGLYVYDLGRSWADGVADPAFGELFQMTLGEIRQLAQMGRYRRLKIHSPVDEAFEGHPVRHVDLQYALPENSQTVDSQLYLTCLRGKIIKVRVSLRSPASAEARQSVIELVQRQIAFVRQSERF